MEKQIETKLKWQCVGHYPTKWALLSLRDGELGFVRAMVTRMDNGKWHWRIWSPYGIGVEPSRLVAMGSAERALNQITIK